MISLIVFIIALVALSALFAVKYWELKRGRLSFMIALSDSCDEGVKRIESYMAEKCTWRSIMQTVKHVYNTLTHKFARVTASIAKKIEWRARSVAHKSAKAKEDGKEVRENKYLKNVQTHKESLDIQKVAEEVKL